MPHTHAPINEARHPEVGLHPRALSKPLRTGGKNKHIGPNGSNSIAAIASILTLSDEVRMARDRHPMKSTMGGR